MTTSPSKPRSASPRATRLPAGVTLDLDSLEREQEFEPFVIRVNGERVTLIDARDLDWQVVARLSADRPFEFFDSVIPKEDQDVFFKAKFPGWKMEELIQKYRDHYGMIGDRGNSRG